tara:strand:- start:122 stop:2074 length:1953 start_codon:yes stop_codon:yes gene_type:complete
MHKYISVLILIIGFSYSLFSQGNQLELDAFNRSIPTANFGGQTWRGPSWVDNAFNDSVATMYPDVLGYPPCADVWDWQNGWFYPQSVLDTCPLDTILLSWGQLNANVIAITPENFQNALNQIGAEGLYCLNMISSSITVQLADLHSAKANGVHLERIRLGDEMGKAGNELSISHFPTAEDYAVRCDIYIDSIRNILPNAKIAVSAGNFGGNSNPRAEFWNDELYNMTNKADAFRWSAFFYLKDADTVFTTKQLLAYAFDQIPTFERVRGFEDTTSNLQNYELWVGYGITDNTLDHRYLNRWSQVLMFSASHHIFLNNKLVEDISMFNVGGIFENWEALDTQNDFRKRAPGIFATIWNKAKLDKNRATKIETPSTLMDTVTYYSNNNTPRNIEYPKLFGWRFENDSTFEASVILTNISEDTLIVSVDNFFVGDVSWEKWHSESLFDLIDSVNYIHLLIDTGLINITLLPYSINVATGNMCNHLTYNSVVSICEGDSIFVATSVYSIEGIYTDSMINMHGCDSVIITDLDFYIQNTPIISMSSFTLETEQTMNNYQWYLDGDSIFAANQFNFFPSIIGNYTVSYLNDNDCFLISNEFLYELVEINNECKSIKQLLKIIDILGKEVDLHTNIDNATLFYMYDDGTVEKKIVID